MEYLEKKRRDHWLQSQNQEKRPFNVTGCTIIVPPSPGKKYVNSGMVLLLTEGWTN